MAASDKGKDKIEIIAGREAVTAADGVTSWKDTGEVITAAERAMLTELGEGKLDFKGEQKQNPDLLFYVYEAPKTPGGKPEANKLRGFVLKIFKRPDNFKSTADDADDGREPQAQGDASDRYACFVMLTAPCLVKTLGKVLRTANIGEKVWVDLNQSTKNIVRMATPKTDDKGNLSGIAEIAIDPSHKEPFQVMVGGKPETRQAWRVGLYGGFDGGPNFRKFGPDQIKRYASHLALPSPFISDEEIAAHLGLPAHNAAPQLTQ